MGFADNIVRFSFLGLRITFCLQFPSNVLNKIHDALQKLQAILK